MQVERAVKHKPENTNAALDLISATKALKAATYGATH